MAATSKKTDGDPDDERSGPGATTGTIAKTEAGEGMFGADIELDSLTDSDDHDEDHHHRKRDRGDGQGREDDEAADDGANTGGILKQS